MPKKAQGKTPADPGTGKKRFGQFFTTHTDYILKGLEPFIEGKDAADVFAGPGDLLDWARRHGAKSVRGWDIDPQYVDNAVIFYNDTFAHPLKQDFIITNPPYLYQNKLADNLILAKSKHTDLYQLGLEKLMDSAEGIVIVPINFLSAENAKYIRNTFLEKFEILKANYFTEQVFEDTSYTVIAFYYRRKTRSADCMEIPMVIYPEKTSARIRLFRKYNWRIGGEFLDRINRYGNRLGIVRLEEEDLAPGNFPIAVGYTHLGIRRTFGVDEATYLKIKRNILILKAIDTGADPGRIRLEDIRKYGYDALVSVKTSRNQISLIFPQNVSIREQEALLPLFNAELEEKRKRYHSLFMTNFRDKGRKRISFTFAYALLNYIYFDKLLGAG
ncbi:MAG: Eco57I restriction-modification methylase domain-containing protein [Spirochaetaceae bacterium]|jgi:predicted RNA methylase|nr:Eco57I restriction-modification methylase domain-containing protein [Spirochaetaceae bacterium]